MGNKAVKIISLLASLAGAGIGLVNNWADDKKIEAKIIEESNKAVEKILKEKGLI